MKKVLVFVLVFVANTAWAAEVAPCDLRNPWQVFRTVTINETEHRLIAPLEVEIFMGSGASVCTLNPKDGVSLVIPKGFDTGVDHGSATAENMSWVKIGNASFPIMSKYKLAVAPSRERVVFMPPQSQQQVFQQPSPLQELNEEKVVGKEGFCGFWCKTAIGVVVVGLIASRNKGGDSSTPTSAGPVNPAP